MCIVNARSKSEIHTINSDAGLYFEETGKVRLYHEEWKIITYINITEIQNSYDYISEIFNHIVNFCQNLPTLSIYDPKNGMTYDIQEGCGNIINLVTAVMHEITQNNVNWWENSQTSRSKRGLINIIGSISKTLFGTLDEDDAKDYLARFNNLTEQGKFRDQILEKHTSLLQSTINYLKDDAKKRDEQIYELKQHTHNIKKEMSEINLRQNKFEVLSRIKNELQDIATYLSLLIMNYQAKQRQYLSAMSVGQKSPNSPTLIPPQLFLNELHRIRSTITARNLDIPIELTINNLPTLYSISTPETRILRNQMIISFTIPLVTVQDFFVYKVTTLPYRIQNNLFSYLIPTHDYIALDSFKEKYVYLSNEELSNCHTISSTSLACPQTTPIMASIISGLCEINILKQVEELDNCNYRIGNFTQEIWVKLRKTNTWLYTFPKRENVYIECGNEVTTQFLTGTGIIAISPDCKIKTDRIIISGFKVTESTLIKEVIPEIKIGINLNRTLNEFLQLKDVKLPNMSTPSIINYGQNYKLEALGLELKELEELKQNYNYNWSPQQVRKDLWILYIIVSIIIIISILAIFKFGHKKVIKFRKSRRPNENNVVPTEEESAYVPLSPIAPPHNRTQPIIIIPSE